MMRCLLVDDHAIVRAGLRRLLGALPGLQISEASTGEAALAALRDTRFDVVTLDLNLPGLGGLVLLERILKFDPGARILVVSMHTEPLYAARALEAGAHGYVSKNAPPEEILEAVRRVAGGRRYVEADVAQGLVLQGGHPLSELTQREIEIMRHLAEGEGLQQIADTLGLAYKTVANTCSLLRSNLGATSTADLVRLAIQLSA